MLPMTRIRVDLRAKFGPSRPVTSPAETRAVTSCKLGTAPIEMEKPLLSAVEAALDDPALFFEEAGASAARQFGLRSMTSNCVLAFVWAFQMIWRCFIWTIFLRKDSQ